MAWIQVRHKVEDYARWKQVFDGAADFKRQHGWKGYQVFAVGGDSNDVLVMEEFETMAQARDFLAAPDLQQAMQRAGLVGPPDILVVEGVAAGQA